ncbi:MULTISPECIES: hypothetical protein [Kitasatospora]|uniref:hypothetical protein n=1 Tax=Kitasatospora TaxID=2063 RepID=UPI0031DC996C
MLLDLPKVAAHGLEAAGEAEFPEFTVEPGDVVTALVPALVQVGLVLVEDGLPLDRPDEELVDAARAGEAAHSGAVQPYLPADRGQRLPFG